MHWPDTELQARVWDRQRQWGAAFTDLLRMAFGVAGVRDDTATGALEDDSGAGVPVERGVVSGAWGVVSGTFDSVPLDVRPDDCWRCDAAAAVDGLGLCGPCGVELRRAS